MGSHYTCRACEQHLDFCKCLKGVTVNAKAPDAKRVARKKVAPPAAPSQDPVAVEELQDFNVSLEEMRNIVEDLIGAHGLRAKIYCDAGHNNVEVLVSPAPLYAKLVSLPDSVLLGVDQLREGITYRIAFSREKSVRLVCGDGKASEWIPVSRVEFTKEAP